MSINASDIISGYCFEIISGSYIGNPKPNTVMYVGRKISSMLSNLGAVNDVLCFVDEDVEAPPEIRNTNAIVRVKNPQLEYAKVANLIWKAKVEEENLIGFDYINGSYISKNAVIGINCHIEPGCLIGHDVMIGNNASILTGTSIKYAVIGNDFLSNEGAQIGTNSYTMATNEDGNKIRIPALGRVLIGEEVEIGANNTISRGSVSDTVINDYVKTDALVHVGHDVIIAKNVEIAAGTIIGGFAEIGEESFLGLNSTLKNRINIGQESIVGMGAAVMKSFPDKLSIAGNPAKGIWKIEK